jgi:hypothetical protein
MTVAGPRRIYTGFPRETGPMGCLNNVLLLFSFVAIHIRQNNEAGPQGIIFFVVLDNPAGPGANIIPLGSHDHPVAARAHDNKAAAIPMRTPFFPAWARSKSIPG